jgi:hypothetical protein
MGEAVQPSVANLLRVAGITLVSVKLKGICGLSVDATPGAI